MLSAGRFSALALSFLLSASASAFAQAVPWATTITASPNAETLPEDRGATGLAQTLNKLRTWASLMMIVAHPDDEDGGMMTLVSRGLGARTALLTLTRGEGGQNAMSSEAYDALGLIRTTELLRADEFSGTEQYWGHFADYGFSKTKEEAFSQWGHDKVLYDVVRAVRINRPLVLASVFVGGITDGHGHHQVAGEIAQEAFTAAGDPSVFPDQIAVGLRPWKPLAVFGRTPFAPVTGKGMFDYATGKWEPTRFYNYVSKEWSTTTLSADVTVPEGNFDPVLGRSYLQMAREGWGEQRSQNGGGTPPLPGPSDGTYHRFGSLVAAGSDAGAGATFFSGIDTTLPGLAMLAAKKSEAGPAKSAAEAASDDPDTKFLITGLREIDRSVTRAFWGYTPAVPEKIATDLRDVYLKTKALMAAVDASSLGADEKANVNHELGIKLVQCNTALVQALGLQVNALVTPAPKNDASGGDPRILTLYPSPTATHVTPGETFDVRLHVTPAGRWGSGQPLQLARTWVATPEHERWQVSRVAAPGMGSSVSSVGDAIFSLVVPHDAAATEPYFTRSSIEQPAYTISDASLLGQSLAPYPVSGWAEFTYMGVPIRVGNVVQTAHHVHGRGMEYEPLVVVPQISVALDTRVAVLTPGESALHVTATVANEETGSGAASQSVTLGLTLPAGWRADPSQVPLNIPAGEERVQRFTVSPPATLDMHATGSVITASVRSGNATYTRGVTSAGYEGLRPYNLYHPATLTVRPVDVHVTPGVHVGYVMGTGDEVPQAMMQLGMTPHPIEAAELLSGDLSRYDTIVLGVRTYTAQPAVATATPRLLAWVKAGGTLVVEYQGPEFDHNYGPYPLAVGSTPERVVDEKTPVVLLAPGDPLLNQPNHITAADFSGWLEERGHGFAASWDSRYTALTETADPGQDPQKGGLLSARYGRGQYIYLAYALYRQLPEGVPGAWRLLANLLSAGHGGK